LKTLKSLLPDIICLQEVTIDFLNLLLDEIWLRENNYYIIIMGSILDQNEKQSYGQLMLTKHFYPRSFSICPLHLSEDSTSRSKTQIKEYIIARFGLNSKVTIDLVNLHLHSYNSDDKRCQSLEYFFRTMNTQNYMLIGDFNFGDYNIKEQHVLQRYQYQIHDLWKEIYDIDEVKFCISITLRYLKLLIIGQRFREKVPYFHGLKFLPSVSAGYKPYQAEL
jgi:endonuclease/exonuclease/phosphatase family metal-dependent hydrolase